MIRCQRASRSATRGRSISFWLALSTAATSVQRQLRGGAPPRGAVVLVGVVAAASFSSAAAAAAPAATTTALAWLPQNRHRSFQESAKPSVLPLHGPFFFLRATGSRTGNSFGPHCPLRLTSAANNMDDSASASSYHGGSPLPPREGRESHRPRGPRQAVNLGLTAEDNDAGSRHDDRDSIRGREAFAGRGRRNRKASPGDGSSGGPLKRKYRPGHNSYLKVVLDDGTLDRLHGAVLRIRDRVQQMDLGTSMTEEETEGTAILPSSGGSGEGAPCSGSPADASDPPIVSVKPRSRDSLHMTLFFGGEVLCELSREELVEFHQRVSAALLDRQESPMFERQGTTYVADADDNCPRLEEVMNKDGLTTPAVEAVPSDVSTIQDERDDPSQRFRLVELCTFPPRRNNLIVALFEPPDAWHEVHESLRGAALNSSSSDLRHVAAASSGGPRWVAHVTLANLLVRKRSIRQQGSAPDWKPQLQELLEEETRQLVPSGDDGAVPSGEGSIGRSAAAGRRVAMGGPVPPQAELDWTFHVAAPYRK